MTAHRFAIFVSAATLVLLFAGGLVTTTASGDAVPDWWFVPVSFGSLLPPMTGGVLFEHGHRLVASTVGLLTIALAVLLWRTEDRAWVRRLGWLAVFGVAAQGTLGGLRVHHVGSPAVIAIIHACFAQIFFGTVVTLAIVTSRGWRTETPVAEPTWLPWVATACCGVVYLQIILGAVRRHTGQWIDVHAAFAGIVTLAVLLAAAECLRRGRFRRTATALVSLLFAQILLGLWSYVLVRGGFVRSVNASALDTVVITGHLALGGLVYALSVALAVRSWRVFRVPAACRTLAGEAAL
ncbi:MAG: COX15/CtaA family protein [Planctomycetes bacterium]|nr:COX15/CtaA family protein [Planctomycetota bacterium]